LPISYEMMRQVVLKETSDDVLHVFVDRFHLKSTTSTSKQLPI